MFEQFTRGVIEGFYGQPWSWPARQEYAEFLGRHGFSFYIYAPKSDEMLRKRWAEDWTAEHFNLLEKLRAQCRTHGIAFGIGLTPYGTQSHYGDEERRALVRKVRQIDRLEPDVLAILFDDVPGITPDLANLQVAIAHDAVAVSRAHDFLFCPTYYSDDEVFDHTLGRRPDHYLEDLGERLDRAIQIFWTGPRICSDEYTESHLADVTSRLGRKPFLWDNYPVNDGPKMSKHLYIRAATGRSYQLEKTAAGLAANPMNQAALSMIPLATLAASFEQREAYDPARAFEKATRKLCGDELASALKEDLPTFHDAGLDTIGASEKHQLIRKYARFSNVFADEVIRWLEGEFTPTREVVDEFVGYT